MPTRTHSADQSSAHSGTVRCSLWRSYAVLSFNTEHLMISRYISALRSRSRGTSPPKNTTSLVTRPTRLHPPMRCFSSRKSFDYNKEYFTDTRARLEIDTVTGNRGLFSAEELGPNELVFITPYYHHVIHASLQSHFCNACHDSFDLLGIKDSALRSKHIKSHLYCSEACKGRGEPFDEAMAPSLKMIQKRDPDFYVSNAYVTDEADIHPSTVGRDLPPV